MMDRIQLLQLLHVECFPEMSIEMMTKAFRHLTDQELLEVFEEEISLAAV